MLFRKTPKVFCIGRNKTGTTTLETALKSLGYSMGRQARAELLLRDWAARSFGPIVRFCRRYDAFQDQPFSLPHTFVALDQAFPGSKFILTVRDSPEVWLDSMIRFSGKLVGVNRRPTAADLANFTYRGDPARHGELWLRHQLIYGATEETLFDPELYIAHYNRHNETVLDYFRHRPNDLLVLNVKDDDAMKRLCAFLGKPFDGQPMPHENASTTGTLAAGKR
jgi:hypothetical protein